MSNSHTGAKISAQVEPNNIHATINATAPVRTAAHLGKLGIAQSLFHAMRQSFGRRNSLSAGTTFARPAITDTATAYLKRRSRSELLTTETLENAIAAPAITGLRKPIAASGNAARL